MGADLGFSDKQTMKVATSALEWVPERKVKHLRTQVAHFVSQWWNFALISAEGLGMTVPRSWVQHFRDEVAIVVERYGRYSSGGIWSRLHQEDLCQALGVHPNRKYEAEGGPRVHQIAAPLRNQSSRPEEDVRSFAEALVFNWLIAGTDAVALYLTCR